MIELTINIYLAYIKAGARKEISLCYEEAKEIYEFINKKTKGNWKEIETK